MRSSLALPLLLLAACGGASTHPVAADGFVPLFDGHSLDGWVRVNCAPETFRVADGMIITTGKPTGVMRTERMYENYIVELDWMHILKGGNSGFFIHSGAMPVSGQPFTKAFEIQVLDGDDPKGQWTGHGDVFAIHGSSFVPDRPHPAGWPRCLPIEKRAHPAGQWNHYKVTVNNGTVKLEVNGKEVSGGTKCNPRKGYICLESEGAPCHFRNLRIKELPSTNPPADQVAEEYQGFHTLYTGLDLRGWTGGDGWKPKDWVLEGTPPSTGVLTTEQSFDNFILIFDWRSTKNGNLEIKIGDMAPFNLNAVVKAGDWDRVVIALNGDVLGVTQDGKKSTQTVKHQGRGPISFKASGEKIQFANLFLCELK